MSQNNNLKPESKIRFIGDYCEIAILKISKKRFDAFKKSGLPSTGAAAENWEEVEEAEELLEELDSESEGSMVFSDSFSLTVEGKDGERFDLTEKYQEKLQVVTNPARLAVAVKSGNYEYKTIDSAGDGKHYLVRSLTSPKAEHSLTLNDSFELDKLAMIISPEQLPGGKVIDLLTMQYDGQVFDYNVETHNFVDPEFVLVDGKGRCFPVVQKVSNEVSEDTSREEISSEWIPAEINPREVGQFEVELETVVWPMPAVIDATWNGATWIDHREQTIKIKRWRTLTTSA